jgi:stage III sporulation protein AH
MINIIANQEFKRKMGWFLVLMLWVGMVTAVVINEGEIKQDHVAEMSSAEGKVEISEVKKETEPEEKNQTKKENEINGTVNDLDLSKVEEEAKENNKNFFVEYRIERDQARSEQINLLREMINNPNSDKKLKTKAQSQLLDITNNIEQEMEIESLVRARGYQDGIAFIHNNSVEVIVAAGELDQSDVAKIGNIVTNTTEVSLDNITIIEKKDE